LRNALCAMRFARDLSTALLTSVKA